MPSALAVVAASPAAEVAWAGGSGYELLVRIGSASGENEGESRANSPDCVAAVVASMVYPMMDGDGRYGSGTCLYPSSVWHFPSRRGIEGWQRAVGLHPPMF
jgi:hypothetical protein